MIELESVYKSYPGSESYAVDNVSFTVERGEFLGLIGESGCGKTTTLKLINRLVESNSGTIVVGGDDVQKRDPVELRRNIGYVFQGIGLFPHYSVEKNVAAVPDLLGWDTERTQRRVCEMLSLVGLAPDVYRHRRPSELSGGQQQRVGVARALVAEPEVVLMDEPFGALDPITRAELQEEFGRIQRDLGLTVIMVTHDMTEVLLMADRIAVMKEGRILQIGTPRELLTEPAHDYVREIVEMPKRRADRLEELMQRETQDDCGKNS
ncbi:MAG TPA: ATP-binding cassette domain-containing protein [Candidatus Hydrogenedentes bacterium]|nr:ATP-binding cassette domain-containing protein [Candidatus Hydrogenedentota bacterium]